MATDGIPPRRWHTITIVKARRTLHIFDFVPCVDDERFSAWHHRVVVRHGSHDTKWFAEATEAIWQPGMSVEELHQRVMKRAPTRHPNRPGESGDFLV